MNTVYRKLPQKQVSAVRKWSVFAALFFCFLSLVIVGGYRVIYFAPQAKKWFATIFHGNHGENAHRGNIFDKDGRPLAMNADQYHAAADLRLLREIYGTLEQVPPAKLTALAKLLDIPPAQLAEKLNSSRDFIYLKKEIPPAQAQDLRRLDIKGIAPQYDSRRFYPNSYVAAHLVGHTDYQGIGRSGLEYAHHRELLPRSGSVALLRTSKGAPLREFDYHPAVDGTDLQLSLDSRLQFFAYDALEKAIARHHARAGAVIVMDVQNGDLLAIANYPSFNPNHILKVDDGLQNRALSDVVEPGSTAKPFVAALALENKKISAEELLPTKKPLRVAGNLTVRDSHIRDDLTIGGVIAKSSNVGAVLLARRVGEQKLWQLYDRLGFGGGKVLDIAEENNGRLNHYRQWRKSDFATHAYGYGFSVNLLQLLRAYSAFATDGVLVQPRLNSNTPTPPPLRVMLPATARQVRQLMEAVATPDGTARRAAIDGYRVAGKTGTTYKWNGTEYDREKPRAFFIGMVPASAPRYLAAVMIDEPRANGFTGGAAAAPVFRAVMQRALLLGGVPPDDWTPPSLSAAAGGDV